MGGNSKAEGNDLQKKAEFRERSGRTRRWLEEGKWGHWILCERVKVEKGVYREKVGKKKRWHLISRDPHKGLRDRKVLIARLRGLSAKVGDISPLLGKKNRKRGNKKEKGKKRNRAPFPGEFEMRYVDFIACEKGGFTEGNQ